LQQGAAWANRLNSALRLAKRYTTARIQTLHLQKSRLHFIASDFSAFILKID
jgi:hypothetical protein